MSTEKKEKKETKEERLKREAEREANEASALVGKITSAGDLTEFVDIKRCAFLNMAPKSIHEPVLVDTKVGGGGFISSNEDVDCQLLLTVFFKEHVKLHEISMASSLPDSAPKKVKLFVNQPNMGFTDVEAGGLRMTEEIIFKKSDIGRDGSAARLKLRALAFQNVSSVSLFVETNQDDLDVTWIERIIFYGLPIVGMNVKEIKKIPLGTFERSFSK